MEAEGARGMQLSLRTGEVRSHPGRTDTICDGIAVGSGCCHAWSPLQVGTPGQLTFALAREVLEDVITVTEEEASEALFHVMERCKLVVEASAVVGVAALLAHRVDITGKTWESTCLDTLTLCSAVAVISGGNIDMAVLANILRRELVLLQRRIQVPCPSPVVADTPHSDHGLYPLARHCAERAAAPRRRSWNQCGRRPQGP